MRYKPTNKRQSNGYCCFEIFLLGFKEIPLEKKEDYLIQFMKLVEDYEFFSRKETDPNLHPNSKNNSWKKIPTSETPKGLLQLIFQPSLESGYNATRAKTMKKILLGELKKYFFENMPFENEES